MIKNRVKIGSIFKESKKDNGVKEYYPINNVLSALEKLSKELGNKKFSYKVKSTHGSHFCSVLLYFNRRHMEESIINNLTLDFCKDFKFRFNCNKYEWQGDYFV